MNKLPVVAALNQFCNTTQELATSERLPSWSTPIPSRSSVVAGGGSSNPVSGGGAASPSQFRRSPTPLDSPICAPHPHRSTSSSYPPIAESELISMLPSSGSGAPLGLLRTPGKVGQAAALPFRDSFGTAKAAEKLAQDVQAFIDGELAVLSSQGAEEQQVGQERLSVYKSAFSMLLPAIPQPIAKHLQHVLFEYDMFLQSYEQHNEDRTRLRERQRLEEHYSMHFTEEARVKEAALDKRKAQFDALQVSLSTKLSNLEKQLSVLQTENRSLKAMQNEESERYSAMAQSVIESRLAANKAELALIDMKELYEKVRFVERTNLEIMQDYGKMLRLLRINKIDFDPKCRAMVDMLIRDGVVNQQ